VEGIPKHRWREIPDWIKSRPWPVLLFAGLFGIAAIAWWTDVCTKYPLLDTLLPLVILMWVALLFAWFVTCFTGDAYENRTHAIEFAYFFMVLSFCLVAVMIADMGKARKFGVVEGCIDNLDPHSVSPVQCDYPLRVRHSSPVRLERSEEETNASAASGADNGAPPATKDRIRTADADAVPSHEELVRTYVLYKNYHYLVNIGGRLTSLEQARRYQRADCAPASQGAQKECIDCKPPVYAVRGGLPVPVYFIVLALIGGAISLAKNVPGIQKRSDSNWVGTAAEPRLVPGEVRELLLFQVLQFVSAPLLAVAAYHTIKPESFGTTVALGFLVGFGSDQILGAIRGMVKAGPSTTPTSSSVTGSITGVVSRGAAPIRDAEVSLLSTTLTATTDEDGEFTLIAVPVKDDPYMLRVSAAGTIKDLQISVSNPAPVTVSIDLG